MIALLQVVSLGLVGLTGVAVVLARNPRRLVIVNSVFGLSLVLLFVILQAPDVALSMLVVNAVAYPLVLLVAVGVIRGEDGEAE
jgi:energy-converting hydrogenase B subunit D